MILIDVEKLRLGRRHTLYVFAPDRLALRRAAYKMASFIKGEQEKKEYSFKLEKH